MEFNKYNLYSLMHGQEKNLKEHDKMLKMLNEIEFFDTSEEIKDFVLNKWNINVDELGATPQNFSIEKDCIINLSNTDELITLNVSYKNENLTCYYSKKES